MRRSCAICFSLLLLSAQPADAKDNQLSGMDEFVAAAMKHWDVPGLAIAVVKDGKVVCAKGYGIREIGSEQAVDPATLFDIASCTKSFTAASVAVLVDRGKLGWDDPVSKHLPTLRFPNDYLTRHVTLRDLLCHRTGLSRGDLIFLQRDLSRKQLLRHIQWLKSEAPFRTKFTYSNLMYVTLHEVVSTVARQPWEQFAQANLLKPLDMRRTTFSLGRQDLRNFAPRHWRDKAKITSRGTPKTGSLYSSADDMAKWLQFQLAAGRYAGPQVISEKSIREMHAMHHAVPIRRTPTNNPYAARFYGAGLGWFTLDYRGRKLVMHGGSWGAIVGILPEENLGVVVLSNLDWNGLTGMLMYRVLDAYCAPSKTVWADTDFQRFHSEGPGSAYRVRNRERTRLEATRQKDTKPTLSLEKYAGDYRAPFYGDLQLVHRKGRLSLRLGRFTTKLVHWENDVFYATAPTRMNYDWLVQCEVQGDTVHAVTLKYVGWKEPDAVFRRTAKRKPVNLRSEHRKRDS